MGGMNLRKGFKSTVLILLLSFSIVFTLDYIRASLLVTALQAEKNLLIEQTSRLEKQYLQISTKTGPLEKENKQLQEEVAQSKSFINYQDFKDAIDIANSYKIAQTFDEAIGYMGIETSFSTLDNKGNCPCIFMFKGTGFKWEPNVILNLTEFRLDKEKIILIFNAPDNEINYQFTMAKTAGWKQDTAMGLVPDPEEKWRIQEIRQN